MKVLANENQSEQEDGQQAQWADQYSEQVHIYETKTCTSDQWHYQSYVCYYEAEEGTQIKNIPANKRHSPSLLPSSRVKYTGETIIKSEKAYMRWG